MAGLKDLILRLQQGEVDLEGTTIRVLSLDALIEAKRAMGRPRDLHAVLELEAIREKLKTAATDAEKRPDFQSRIPLQRLRQSRNGQAFNPES